MRSRGEIDDGQIIVSAISAWEIAMLVERGKVVLTIAGNLKDMLRGIEAVGADVYNYGAKGVGSILLNRMKVAGS